MMVDPVSMAVASSSGGGPRSQHEGDFEATLAAAMSDSGSTTDGQSTRAATTAAEDSGSPSTEASLLSKAPSAVRLAAPSAVSDVNVVETISADHFASLDAAEVPKLPKVVAIDTPRAANLPSPSSALESSVPSLDQLQAGAGSSFGKRTHETLIPLSLTAGPGGTSTPASDGASVQSYDQSYPPNLGEASQGTALVASAAAPAPSPLSATSALSSTLPGSSTATGLGGSAAAQQLQPALELGSNATQHLSAQPAGKEPGSSGSPSSGFEPSADERQPNLLPQSGMAVGGGSIKKLPFAAPSTSTNRLDQAQPPTQTAAAPALAAAPSSSFAASQLLSAPSTPVPAANVPPLIAQMAQTPGQVRLALSPEGLGTVLVQVSSTLNGIAVTVTASEQALSAIGRLAVIDSLVQAGLPTARVDFVSTQPAPPVTNGDLLGSTADNPQGQSGDNDGANSDLKDNSRDDIPAFELPDIEQVSELEEQS